MKRQPLRRLLADARQAFEFVDEFGYWFGVFKHDATGDGSQGSGAGVDRVRQTTTAGPFVPILSH